MTAAGRWAVSRSGECRPKLKAGVDFLRISPVVTLEAVCSVWRVATDNTSQGSRVAAWRVRCGTGSPLGPLQAG